jgi:NAD(P)-dependent dehydrogenase (short-subunit alcohol dehydrogenase family)
MIEEAGGSAIFQPCDVANEADVDALFERTIEAFGRLDIAHNNAGGGRTSGKRRRV